MLGHQNAIPSVPKTTTVWVGSIHFYCRPSMYSRIQGDSERGCMAGCCGWYHCDSVRCILTTEESGKCLAYCGSENPCNCAADAITGLHEACARRESWYQQCRARCFMSEAAKAYAKYFINGKLQNPSPSGAESWQSTGLLLIVLCAWNTSPEMQRHSPVQV